MCYMKLFTPPTGKIYCRVKVRGSYSSPQPLFMVEEARTGVHKVGVRGLQGAVCRRGNVKGCTVVMSMI